MTALNAPAWSRLESALPAGSRTLRRLTLALLAGALLTAPLPAHAVADSPCQQAPASQGRRIGYAYVATPLNQGQTGVRAPFALHLTVGIARDGAARASGSIAIPDDAAAAPLAPYAPLLVIAKNVVGICADLDGDGRIGLARLEGDARVAATGELARFVLTPIEHDVDAVGAYRVALQIDDDAATAEAHFRIADEHHPRKGRRSR